MIESIIASVMTNLEIIAAFIAALVVYRSWSFALVCFAVVLVCLTPDKFFENQYATTNTFAMISLVFISLAVMLLSGKKYLPSIATLLLAVYCAVFATDTWANSNEKTWIFINHENIIVGLYAAVLLSFSKRVSALVDACTRVIVGFSANIKPNTINNPSHKRRDCEAKNK